MHFLCFKNFNNRIFYEFKTILSHFYRILATYTTINHLKITYIRTFYNTNMHKRIKTSINNLSKKHVYHFMAIIDIFYHILVEMGQKSQNFTSSVPIQNNVCRCDPIQNYYCKIHNILHLKVIK